MLLWGIGGLQRGSRARSPRRVCPQARLGSRGLLRLWAGGGPPRRCPQAPHSHGSRRGSSLALDAAGTQQCSPPPAALEEGHSQGQGGTSPRPEPTGLARAKGRKEVQI